MRRGRERGQSSPMRISYRGVCCIVTGCTRLAKARALCGMHYNRWWRSGDVGGVGAGRKPRPTCIINGCERSNKAHGWCHAHYLRWRRSGTPFKKHALYIDSRGYKRIYKNGRLCAEHRHVLESVLGRPLLPSENVHHKNGVRSDNRPENLELWVTSQPPGQRPEDLVAWATEIITRYGQQAAAI